MSTEEENSRFEQLQAMYKNKDISECFANLHMTINKEIDTVKHEIKATNARVDMLESHAQLADDQVRVINEQTVPNIEDKIEVEANERIRLELWGRKWNLVIGGIEGTLSEPPRETEKKVRAFFETSLNMSKEDANAILLQAVHRLPGGKDEKKRRIIVRFNSLIVRDEILAAAMKFQRGSGYSIVPDVPPSVSTLRHKLLMKRRAMPQEVQKKTILVYIKNFPFVALRTKSY